RQFDAGALDFDDSGAVVRQDHAGNVAGHPPAGVHDHETIQWTCHRLSLSFIHTQPDGVESMLMVLNNLMQAATAAKSQKRITSRWGVAHTHLDLPSRVYDAVR